MGREILSVLPGAYSLGVEKPILLIESDRSYASLVKAAFSKVRVHNPIALAANAHEAVVYLERLKEQSQPLDPALIILGLVSPWDCSAMVRWLRRQPDLLHVPCVVFSGESRPGKNRVPRELVCDSYVRKPGDFSALISFASEVRDKWLHSAGTHNHP